MADLTSEFVGIKSPNPFWLASAPPTDKEHNVRRAFEAGWGGVVWKTLGEAGPPVVNVNGPRYGAIHGADRRLLGLNNIELITDRPLEVNLREIKAVKRDYPDVPIVIISGHGNIEIAVAAIKQGAYDFIEKPFNLDQLLVVIRRAMETSRLRQENVTLKRSDAFVGDMIGSGSVFKALNSNLDKVTKSNGRVMLTGPAGVGKEVAAR